MKTKGGPSKADTSVKPGKGSPKKQTPNQRNILSMFKTQMKNQNISSEKDPQKKSKFAVYSSGTSGSTVDRPKNKKEKSTDIESQAFCSGEKSKYFQQSDSEHPSTSKTNPTTHESLSECNTKTDKSKARLSLKRSRKSGDSCVNSRTKSMKLSSNELTTERSRNVEHLDDSGSDVLLEDNVVLKDNAVLENRVKAINSLQNGVVPSDDNCDISTDNSRKISNSCGDNSVDNEQTSTPQDGSNKSVTAKCQLQSKSHDENSLSNQSESNQRQSKPPPLPSENDSQGDLSENMSQNPDPYDGDDKEEVYRVPYYLENFLLIMDTVLKDEYYHSLFNTEDRAAIATFSSLTEDCQKLYVRLFQRQHRWLRHSKIQYPNIAADLTPLLQQLIDAKLLKDRTQLEDLETVLGALPAPELKTLAKTLKLPVSITQKDDIASAILKHSQKSGIGSFFKGAGQDTTSKMILKRAKDLLGCVCKLEPGTRHVFLRIIMLFGLHQTRGEDDESGGGQQQIFQMLMTAIGRIKYPEYTVSREAELFKDRDGFLRFVTALQTESDLGEALESKDYSEASRIYDSVRSVAYSVMSNHDYLSHDRSLPRYLRVYSAGSVYTRVLSQGVELLQFQKKYHEAANELESLLDQLVYHQDYRGRWYDRLALNLDHHLKKHNKALDVIQKALSDDHVKTGHRLSLLQRAQRICSGATRSKFIKERSGQFENDPMYQVQDAPKVYIEGCRLSCGQQGPLYISRDGGDEDSVTILTRVEDVALQHYKQLGYTEGIHGEGGTFTSLFALFLWDIIFLSAVPDTFYNPYQLYPLDWGTSDFYSRRQREIDSRLAEIKQADTETLECMLQTSWDKHQDTLCVGMHWERFRDVEHAKGLVRSMGGEVLAGVLERLSRNMRHSTGGVPDLAVWNPDTKQFKMVEVKGPGDRLSTKQILWLDYLIKIGAEAEVCHVQAIGAKKLRS